MAMKRLSVLSNHQHLSPKAQELASNIKTYMEDSEREVVNSDLSIVHQFHDNSTHSDTELDKMPSNLKEMDDVSISNSRPKNGELPGHASPPIAQFKDATLSDTSLPHRKGET